MEILAFWFVGSIIVGIIASSRERSGFGYFMLSLLLSPLLIGVLVLAIGKPDGAPPAVVAVATDTGDIATPETHVRCPDCRELVRIDARKCKHCGTALIPS